MAEATQHADSQEDEKLLEKLFNSSPDEWTVDRVSEGELVSNFGPVSTMILPGDWQPGRARHNLMGQSAYEELRPANEPDVRFSCFYTGVPYGQPEAGACAEILRQPPHPLQQQEFESIRQLLRGKENPEEFETLSIETEDLRGKRVLVLRGIYREDQRPMMAILINSDGSGSVIQELEYQAPLEKYAQYLPQIEQAIKSISWR